jgi:hypothetical protein
MSTPSINPTPARVSIGEALIHAHRAKEQATAAFEEVRDALLRKCPNAGTLQTSIGRITLSDRETVKVDLDALIECVDIETLLLLVKSVNVPLLRQLIEAGAIDPNIPRPILSTSTTRAVAVRGES